MVYAGHTDPNTAGKHYLPRNGADGQSAYFGEKGRTHVLDMFRGLTLPRNPSLVHSLPAKKQYELETRQDFIDIQQEIENPNSVTRRQVLYRKKNGLLQQELRHWQKQQPIRLDDNPGYHRAIFDRVRFMIPERHRLAINLFQLAEMRSDIAVDVLNDMISL